MKLILGCILIITCCSTYNKSAPTSPNDKEITFFARIKDYQEADDTDISYIRVTTVLTNNSKDTFSYPSWLCGWTLDYTADTYDLNIMEHMCMKNFPITRKVPPGDSVVRELNLNTQQSIEYFTKTPFKIGIHLMGGGYSRAEDHSNWSDVSWSNSLTIIK